MLSAQSPIPLEGAPWQVRALVVGIPAVLGALGTLVLALRGKKSSDPEPPPPPPPSTQGVPTVVMTPPPPPPPPPTADGKLELVERYVASLERNETTLRAQAAAFETRAQQLETQVETLQQQAAWFKERLDEQVQVNRYLRSLLDQRTPPPQGPPPPLPRTL